MTTLIIPVALGIGALMLLLSGKKGSASNEPIRINAGEVWSIGVRTSKPMTEADWLEYFQHYDGEILGVTPGRGANEYMVTSRFNQNTAYPPIGFTFRNPDGSTVTLLHAVRAPVA